MEAKRENPFEENDDFMQNLLRNYDAFCAKCLLEGHDALFVKSSKCTKGTNYTDANTLTVMNDAKIGLSREDSDDKLGLFREESDDIHA